MDLEQRIVELLEQNNTLLTTISRGFEDGNFGSPSAPNTPQQSSNKIGFGLDIIGQFSDTLRNSGGDVSRSFNDLQKNISLALPFNQAQAVSNALGQMSSGMINFTNESFEAQQALKKFGVELGGDVLAFQDIAASLNMDVRDTQRFIADNAVLFARMGPSVTEAVQQFRTFRNMMDDTGVEKALISMGMQFDELNEYTARYLAMRGIQDLSDQAETRRRMTDMILFRQAIQDFADITGQDAEQVEADARAMFESEAGARLRMRYGDDVSAEITSLIKSLGLDSLKGFALEDNFAVAAAMNPDAAPLATAQELNKVANIMKQEGFTLDEARDRGLLNDLVATMQKEGNMFANMPGAPLTPIGQEFGKVLGNLAAQNLIMGGPEVLAEIMADAEKSKETRDNLEAAGDPVSFANAMQQAADDFAGGTGSAMANFVKLQTSIAEISSSLRSKVANLEQEFETSFNNALDIISNSVEDLSRNLDIKLDPNTEVSDASAITRIQGEISRLEQKQKAGTITEDEKQQLQQFKEELKKMQENVEVGRPVTDQVDVNVVKFLGSEKLPETTEDLGGPIAPGAGQTFRDFANTINPRNWFDSIFGGATQANPLPIPNETAPKTDNDNQARLFMDTLPQLLDRQDTTNSKLDKLTQAITDGSIRQADATMGAAQVVTSEARSGNLPNLFARTTGVQVN